MILLTSAGGKTGRAMISTFAAAGEKVRAVMRRDDADAELMALGAVEVVHADLMDAAAMADAAKGCRAIYYICPNMTEQEQTFGENIIAAAKAAEVDRLVFHSVLHTQVQALQHHWNRLFVEEAILESGVPYSILQVGSYYQNMLPGWVKMKETGIHAMAYEVEAPMSLVDLGDVADAAVKVLNDPGCANGIFEICGPVITLTEKAEILSDVLGQPIEARKLPADDAVAHAAHMGVGEFGQDCMRRMFAHYDIHGLVGSARVLEWIIGRPPVDFETFARKVAE
ncbi:MAG: NmrA family NAD(P)-binding protein [Rhodospirillaceae bacterium]|nr:NmrA family NAD(P)-binding protein [Rhodospirillaceae bacterium]